MFFFFFFLVEEAILQPIRHKAMKQTEGCPSHLKTVAKIEDTPDAATKATSVIPITQDKNSPTYERHGRPSLFKILTNEDGGVTTQPKPHISGDKFLATKFVAIFADRGDHNQEHD